MKLNTLYLMIGMTSALTGCASTPELNKFVGTLLQPPQTQGSTEEDSYAAEQAAKYDANGNIKADYCNKIEGSLAISDRAAQIKCAEQASNRTEASYSQGTGTLSARNPPELTTMGEQGKEGETLFDRDSGLYRHIIIDRHIQLTETGFSMDYVPMSDSTIYKMEFRLTTSDECQGFPAMEQTVWADQKNGAPQAKKIHCFENGEKRFISMMADMNMKQGRMLFVDGTVSGTTPSVHVYESEMRKVY